MSAPEPVDATPEPRTDDWSEQAADTIVDFVGQVREKTTGPVITGARALVFGVLVLVLAVIALVGLTIGLTRAMEVLVLQIADWAGAEMARSTAVWLSYLIMGGLFTLIGLVLWRVANRRAVAPAPSVDGPGE